MTTDLTLRIEQDVRVAQKRLGELATVQDILRWINHQCHRNYTLEQVRICACQRKQGFGKERRRINIVAKPLEPTTLD